MERVLRIYNDILKAYRDHGITIEQLQDMYLLDLSLYQKAQLAKVSSELYNTPEGQLQIDTDYQTVIKSEDDIKSFNLAFKMLKDEFESY
ncbi:MAG: hypothetical protein J6J17_00670 [Bacilli bacterium]|nr:hypothetical protein [Bacilli bacterium]